MIEMDARTYRAVVDSRALRSLLSHMREYRAQWHEASDAHRIERTPATRDARLRAYVDYSAALRRVGAVDVYRPNLDKGREEWAATGIDADGDRVTYPLLCPVGWNTAMAQEHGARLWESAGLSLHRVARVNP